jgi:hypothetical protein
MRMGENTSNIALAEEVGRTSEYLVDIQVWQSSLSQTPSLPHDLGLLPVPLHPGECSSTLHASFIWLLP